MPKIRKLCKCGKYFDVYPYRDKISKYCSRICTGKFYPHKSGYKCPKGSLAKMGKNNPMFGKQLTTEHREKISNALSGEKSYAWKGDEAGIKPKHAWIRRMRGTPRYCEHCKRTDRKQYDWANKDHKYRRVLSDWLRLCTGCHRKYDIEYNNYKQNPSHE